MRVIHSTVLLGAGSVCSTNGVQEATACTYPNEAGRPDDLCKGQHLPPGANRPRADSPPSATRIPLVSRGAPRKFHQSATRFKGAERRRAVLPGSTSVVPRSAAESTLITKSFVSYNTSNPANVESGGDGLTKESIESTVAVETGCVPVKYRS